MPNMRGKAPKWAEFATALGRLLLAPAPKPEPPPELSAGPICGAFALVAHDQNCILPTVLYSA